MMGEATQDNTPFQFIVVYELRNFAWSLDETVLCWDRLRVNGVTLVSTAESSTRTPDPPATKYRPSANGNLHRQPR